MPYIKDLVANYVEVNKSPNTVNWFNQFNKNMNFMKLIQTRYNATSCNFNRFKFNSTNTYCLDPSKTDTSRFIWGSYNSTYYTDQITNDNTFQGVYQDYDNSGYNYTIDINNAARFNKTMKDLIDVIIHLSRTNGLTLEQRA